MDIVERLRGLPIVVTENGRTGVVRMGGALLSEAADEIERFRKALQKIADIEHEDIPAPTTPNEANVWTVLAMTIGLAEKALKESK